MGTHCIYVLSPYPVVWKPIPSISQSFERPDNHEAPHVCHERAKVRAEEIAKLKVHFMFTSKMIQIPARDRMIYTELITVI